MAKLNATVYEILKPCLSFLVSYTSLWMSYPSCLMLLDSMTIKGCDYIHGLEWLIPARKPQIWMTHWDWRTDRRPLSQIFLIWRVGNETQKSTCLRNGTFTRKWTHPKEEHSGGLRTAMTRPLTSSACGCISMTITSPPRLPDNTHTQTHTDTV